MMLCFVDMGTCILKRMLASVVFTPMPVQGVISRMLCISSHHLALFVSHLRLLSMELRIVSSKLMKTLVLVQFLSIKVRTDHTLLSSKLLSYRNRLLPKNVQALLCTRNWLRGFAEYQSKFHNLLKLL